MIDERWNLNTIPPKGHADVGEFAHMLFDIARLERERLGKDKDYLANYALYRGKSSRQQSARKGFSNKPTGQNIVNLYFANIERTVSNITARNPTGEVVDLDGVNTEDETILSMHLKKWWKETDQLGKTRQSARKMEIYGITSEKPYWDKGRDRPDVSVNDPFGFFPCPGNWEDISTEAPYICYAYVDFISNIEAMFKTKDIKPNDAYELMGAEREDYKAQGYGIQQSIGNYSDPVTVRRSNEGTGNKALQRCFVVEVWVRDSRMTKKTSEPIPVIDPETQQPVIDAGGNPVIIQEVKDIPVYPDGIRKITITESNDPKNKSGFIVLEDCANPNINPALDVQLAKTTYPWGRLPAYHANSYKDGVSIHGFAASEQVAGLLMDINRIVRKLVNYVIEVMQPPLVISQHCGITREMIDNDNGKSGRLVLMPTNPNAVIKFLEIPNLPATFFQVLDIIIKFFDRVYQIEDADRGVAPTGVIAASAIVALQERNATLMQSKTSAIDTLAEQRSRWAIGLFQNFGTVEDSVSVGGNQVLFRGVQYAGRKFNYVVESGSMSPRTSLQAEEQAKEFFKLGAIDARALLETTKFPNWKQIIERTGETQLDMALQVLIAAGLPEETALKLKQFLLQSQGGPGDTTQAGQQPGTPRAQQGQEQ